MKSSVISLTTSNIVINLSGSCAEVVTSPALGGFWKYGTFVLPVSFWCGICHWVPWVEDVSYPIFKIVTNARGITPVFSVVFVDSYKERVLCLYSVIAVGTFLRTSVLGYIVPYVQGHTHIRDCNSLVQIDGSDMILVLVLSYTIYHVVGIFLCKGISLVVLCNRV